MRIREHIIERSGLFGRGLAAWRAGSLAIAIAWLLIGALAPKLHAAETAQIVEATEDALIVPAARQANKIAIITIQGGIDSWTVLSVERRMQRAEAIGADAIVFELDTPGGEVGAVLEICTAIKNSSIPNTVAWVRPDAYSGGAIIALACREIVVVEYATMGDALPIQIGPMGLQQMPAEERQKILAPLLAEIVDSARRRNYDEKLVQGFVTLGVELWLVENTQTGERLFVDEQEYIQLVGEQPVRMRPTVASGRATDTGGGMARSRTDALEQLAREVDENVSIPSNRPEISGAMAGDWELVEYVTDGMSPLTLKSEELARYGFAVDKVRSDTELVQFFGGVEFYRLNSTWSEKLARFLSSMPVRGVLIVVLLLSLFLEMASPGLGVPGAIAGVSLLALFAPAVMVNAAAWWALAAVVGGILLVLIEVLVIPGFGVFGIGGLVMLIGGLIGLLAGPGLFAPGAGGSERLGWAAATIVLALFTSFVGMWLIARHLGSIPFMNRLVLTSGPENGDGSSMFAAMASTVAPTGVAIGDVGVARTPLRPSGSAEFNDQLVDVVCETGFIESGAAVRVISVAKYRVAVEPADEGEAQA